MSEPAVKQIVLASRPKGLPTPENLRLEEVPMPEVPQGGLLLRVLYLSLDPYMRGRMDDRKSYAKPASLGEVMTGESVCEVIASDQAGYGVGDIVLAPTGWRTHAASTGAALRKLDPAVAPITTGLGVLGMPGFTAYAGLTNVYFENVGGAVWQAVLSLLNKFARVPVCGLIAQYDATGPEPRPNLLPATMREVLSKSLTLRGYINYEFAAFAAEHYPAFLRTVGAGVADGRIRYREDITDGLENAPAAFVGMLEGCNFGKALVCVTPSA
jgi:NADPH-dependent curcumin reductase CurA